jgi:hypothetical protein
VRQHDRQRDRQMRDGRGDREERAGAVYEGFSSYLAGRALQDKELVRN